METNETCMSRRVFMGGAAALAATGWGADKAKTADWTPPERWRGFNLLGMFRCPTFGLASDPRVDGHFVEWEFKALHEWGFNFARLPLDYRILMKEDSWTSILLPRSR